MRMMRGMITLDRLQNYVFCFLDRKIVFICLGWPVARRVRANSQSEA